MRTFLLVLTSTLVACASGLAREQVLGSWKLVQANGESRHGVVRDALRHEPEVILTFRADGTWTSTTLTAGAPACLVAHPWSLEHGALHRGGSVVERARFSGGELVVSPDLLLKSPVTGGVSEGRYARAPPPKQPVCPSAATR